VKAEGVELYRALEEAEQGRYRPDLARALNNLDATLSKLGQLEEALTITGQAVTLFRVLLETEPTAYQGRLADALIQWSGILLDLGRLEEAGDPRREADFYGRTNCSETERGRRVAPLSAVPCGCQPRTSTASPPRPRPDAFLPDLAESLRTASLLNLNDGYSECEHTG
jgi:tetratricopeptide (TPR) repeat protein